MMITLRLSLILWVVSTCTITSQRVLSYDLPFCSVCWELIKMNYFPNIKVLLSNKNTSKNSLWVKSKYIKPLIHLWNSAYSSTFHMISGTASLPLPLHPRHIKGNHSFTIHLFWQHHDNTVFPAWCPCSFVNCSVRISPSAFSTAAWILSIPGTFPCWRHLMAALISLCYWSLFYF